MNSFQIRVRSFARNLGLIALINRLRPQRSYEHNFHRALVAAVKPGDVIWDIGANVGVYTAQFCTWVGPGGQVVAFEPSPESAETIRRSLPDCLWLLIENVALGESDAKGTFVVSGDSVEHHLAMDTDQAAPNIESVPVVVSRGDTVCERLGREPNVIKVDVEGFEEEVLSGMGKVLVSPSLRSVLVEVHFMKLELRGRSVAPVRIEKLLRESGFKTKWVDASHLVGTR